MAGLAAAAVGSANLQEFVVKLAAHCVLIVAIGMALASPASAELPRRAPLGVALGPAQPGQPSRPTDEPRVTTVIPGLSADALG